MGQLVLINEEQYAGSLTCAIDRESSKMVRGGSNPTPCGDIPRILSLFFNCSQTVNR